ncbi:hypothetical protein, partial [Candidatus Hakubella thermalkaliphila]
FIHSQRVAVTCWSIKVHARGLSASTGRGIALPPFYCYNIYMIPPAREQQCSVAVTWLPGEEIVGATLVVAGRLPHSA